jgi:hypothetical protein
VVIFTIRWQLILGSTPEGRKITFYQEISLNRRTIIRLLAGTTLFLLLVSIAGQIIKYGFGHDQAFGFVRLFYVEYEGNIPTFFSSILLLLASLLLALITVLKKASHDAYSRHWTILTLILLYMAVDEAAGIHEMLNKVGWLVTGGQRKEDRTIFFFGWVLFGMAMVMIVALSYLKFFFNLPPRTRIQFFTAAAVFVGGAIGVEILGGYYAKSHGEGNFQFSMFSTVEEGLEMAGVIVLINALLNYLIDHYRVRLGFEHFRDSS